MRLLFALVTFTLVAASCSGSGSSVESAAASVEGSGVDPVLFGISIHVEGRRA